jgi:GH24 family phage-related lysozyme (muramidase)
MTPEQLATIKQHIEASEGRIPWLYLDTRGNPTCGIGHLVRTLAAAQALPFQPPITFGEWTRLLTVPNGLRATSYQIDSQGRLSETDIDALLDADLAECEAGLREHFLEFGQWPDSAQAAVLDMAFNLGVVGLLVKFPSLAACVCAEDWVACTTRCHRIGISAERNAATVALFTQASKGATHA